MPTAIALTEGSLVEVISAYSASNDQIAPVVTTPGWHVVGAFQLGASAGVRLELVGMVSTGGLLMRARLFDTIAVLPVSGTTTPDITSTIEQAVVAPTVDLVGSRVYQIQVEVIGSSGFGVVHSATLV